MKRRERKGMRWLGMALALTIFLSVFTASLGAVAAGAKAPTRSVVPTTVNPGDEVTVTLNLETPSDNWLFWIGDYVPLGWEVTDMIGDDEPFVTNFNASAGMVSFAWLNLGSGVELTARYTLHVPSDAGAGNYLIHGKIHGLLSGSREEWCSSLPNGTVRVERDYGVELSVDEPEKSTAPNDPVTYYITVKNTGGLSDTYTLGKLSQADFAQLNKTTVSLGSGGSEVVALTVSSGSPGRYNTTVSATGTVPAFDELIVTTEVVADTTSPGQITDLVASNPTSTTIDLSWTAPGDDGNTGQATSYDIRYLQGTTPITNGNWASATPVAIPPTPQVAGSSETFTVTGLAPNMTYYFAIKTSDEVPNVSPISNSPSGTTTEAGVLPRWDINEDGEVDDLDLGLLLLHYGETTSSPYPRWDINEDGEVDDLDLGLLLLHYGE